MNAKDIMSKPVITVSETTTLNEALDLMRQNGIKHLVVVKSVDQIVGMISDRDVKKFASPFVGSSKQTKQDVATFHIPLKNIMNKQVVSVNSDDSIKIVVEKMLQHTIHAIPVKNVADDTLIGVITATDITRQYLSILA